MRSKAASMPAIMTSYIMNASYSPLRIHNNGTGQALRAGHHKRGNASVITQPLNLRIAVESKEIHVPAVNWPENTGWRTKGAEIFVLRQSGWSMNTTTNLELLSNRWPSTAMAKTRMIHIGIGLKQWWHRNCPPSASILPYWRRKGETPNTQPK